MSGDQERMSHEELRLLCHRVKLIDRYIDTLESKRPTEAGQQTTPPPPPLLPSLRDALSLDIPLDLKQRISTAAKSSTLLVNRSTNTFQFGFTLGQHAFDLVSKTTSKPNAVLSSSLLPAAKR